MIPTVPAVLVGYSKYTCTDTGKNNPSSSSWLRKSNGLQGKEAQLKQQMLKEQKHTISGAGQAQS